MSLKDVLGQNNAINILQNELQNNTIKHAYIFYGIKGIGKKFTAIQFAKTLFCENKINSIDACDKCDSCIKIDNQFFPDVIIVDFNFQIMLEENVIGEENIKEKKVSKVIKIETIREVQRLANLTSYSGKQKIFIIDAAETMQRHAANSLLKTLEEPPKNCIFILISVGLGMLPKTILSRCELINFLPLNENILKKIVPGKTDTIYKNSFGSIENIAYLEKIVSYFDITDLKKMSYRNIQTLSDELSKNKELTKFFLFYLIENLLKTIAVKREEKIFDDINQFTQYCSRIGYNLDLKLFLDTILIKARNLWNKN